MPNASTATLTVIAIIVVLSASCLLISAPPGSQDTQAWAPDSLLRPLVEILALHHEHPTAQGVAVKALAHHVGTVLVIGIVAVGWFAATRRELAEPPAGESRAVAETRDAPPSGDARAATPASALRLLPTAHVAVLALVGLAAASALWSHAPQYAGYAALLLAIQFAWAVGIARALTLRGAWAGAVAVVVVLTLTAIVAIWYRLERGSAPPLGYPVGDPDTLGACLVPGLLLAPALVLGRISARASARRGATSTDPVSEQDDGRAAAAWGAVLPALAMILLVWAMLLSHAPVAQASLAAGAAAFVFFASRSWSATPRRRVTWGILLLALTVSVAGVSWATARAESVGDARSASLRGHFYFWRYARDLFAEQPILGHGWGSYALLVPSRVPGDLIHDPFAFVETGVAHAQNEWLESLAESGAVGGVLLALIYGMTLLAGSRALRASDLSPLARSTLVGLLAALVAMMVEECGYAGLRTEAFPAVYYTVLGLIWAVLAAAEGGAAGPRSERGVHMLLRVAGLVFGLFLSAVVLRYAVLDWDAARDTIRADEAFSRGELAEGLGFAQRSANNRLSPVGRVRSGLRLLKARADTTRSLMERAERRLNTARTAVENRRRVLLLAGQDLLEARMELDEGLAVADRLNAAVPGLSSVAGYESGLAGSAVFIHDRSRVVATALGLPPATAPAPEASPAQPLAAIHALATAPAEQMARYRKRALAAAERLVRASPFTEGFALTLWQMTRDRPIAEQIKLFLRVLRGGQVSGQFVAAAAALAQHPEFAQTFGAMLQRAQRGATSARSSEPTDAPDVLRMAALLAERSGREVDAIRFAEEAVRGYAAIAARFPEARAAALADLARMQFHADPADATRAVASARAAVATIEPLMPGAAIIVTLRQDLVLYLLAAGDEAAARAEVVRHGARTDVVTLDKTIGQLHAVLAGQFLNTPPDRRPPDFGRWIERAQTLSGDSPVVQGVRARWAIQQKRGRDVVDAIEKLFRARGPDPQVASLLRRALEQMPDDEAVVACARAHHVTTQPATAPATRPAPTLPHRAAR